MSLLPRRLLANVIEEAHAVQKLGFQTSAHIKRMVSNALRGIALNLLFQFDHATSELELLVKLLLRIMQSRSELLGEDGVLSSEFPILPQKLLSDYQEHKVSSGSFIRHHQETHTYV